MTAIRFRDANAGRVAAFVVSFVLHAAGLLWLSRPHPTAPLPSPQALIVVRVDLAEAAPVPPVPPTPASPLPPPKAVAAAPAPRPRPSHSSPPPPPSTRDAPPSDPVAIPTPAVRVGAPAEAGSGEPRVVEAPLAPALPSPEPAAALPAASPAVPADVDTAKHASDWRAIVLAHLEPWRRYPFAAQRARQEGTADVRFRVDRQGRVLFARIERSSGSAALDEESVAVVSRAQPLPPPPAEMGGETIEVVVPVRFRLRR